MKWCLIYILLIITGIIITLSIKQTKKSRKRFFFLKEHNKCGNYSNHRPRRRSLLLRILLDA